MMVFVIYVNFSGVVYVRLTSLFYNNTLYIVMVSLLGDYALDCLYAFLSC